MKELILKILKESEDEFGWAEEITSSDLDFEPGAIYYKYGDNKAVRTDILKNVVSQLSDLENKGDRVILKTDGLCDFTDLFKDGYGQGYINKYIAEQMLCYKDDFWEPYHASDLVSNREWKSTIWNGLVIKNKEVLDEVLNHIRKNYVSTTNYNPDQLDIFNELPKKQSVVEIKGRILDEDYFYELKNDLDELGDLIDDEDEFLDLKHELTWAYGDAYNTASRDQIWESIVGAIENDFGKGEWKKSDGKETKHYMEFDVTDLFWSTVFNFFDECFYNCIGKSKELSLEEITNSCDDCMTPGNEYNYFLNLYRNMLKESGNEYSPRYQEWPDDDDLEKHFIESVMNRI